MPRKRREVQPGRRIASEGTLRRHAQSSNSAIFRSRVVKASPRDLLFVSSNTIPLSTRERTMNPCRGSTPISIRPRLLTQQDVVFLALRTDPRV